MQGSFIGKVGSLVAIIGSVFVVILAAFGYSVITAFQKDDEAISKYSEELTLGWSLQEAVQRKLATSRAYLMTKEIRWKREMDDADRNVHAELAALRRRINNPETLGLLDSAELEVETHDRALRGILHQAGSPQVGRIWLTQLAPEATRLHAVMRPFVLHKQQLYDRAKGRAGAAQQQALWITGSIALVALLAGGLGAFFFMRAARAQYASETTARAAAERQRSFFTALLDQLPIGIVAAEAPSGKIVLVSDWARHLLSLEEPRALEVRYANDFEKFHTERSDGSVPEAQPLTRALKGEVVHGEELSAGRGRTIFSVTAGPIRNQAGLIVAAVAALTDVTSRKLAERERELFLGVLGHDLKNPLHAILLAADALRHRRDLPAAAVQPAARIASSAHRMSQLICELLDFTRSQHGTIPIHPEPCQLSEVADEVVGEIKLAHPTREIRVEPVGSCEGRWDRARLAQVFQNLVVNAVEHGAPDCPVAIKTGRYDGMVWARVENQGNPIPDEERQRLFEPFHSSGKSHGLGLGLYIARAIIEAHGGTIHLETRDCEIAFVIELPPEVPHLTRSDRRQPSANPPRAELE